jgi:hypothetical protein
MNERQVNDLYKLLQREEKFHSQIASIERLKKTITPQKNMELKTLLVGASQREGSLLNASLRVLDKKINQIDASMSKESMAREKKAKQLITNVKIQRSVSIRNRKLKNKFNTTRRFKGPAMSPIQEGSRESESKSPWQTIPSKPKKRKWFFGLF